MPDAITTSKYTSILICTLQGVAKAQEDPKVFVYIFATQRKKIHPG